jgi:amino acid transporter
MLERTDELARLGYTQELKRSLGLWDLLAYGLVFITPLAPIALFGIVLNASHGMVPLVYVLGLVTMLFTALSYRAMSSAYPVAGSVFTYASRSLTPTLGFLGGWAILLDYLLTPAITYVGTAIAVHSALPAVSPIACIVVMLVTATAINYLGIQTTVRVGFALLAFQLALIIIFSVLAAHALLLHAGGAHLSLAPFYRPSELTPQLAFGALSLAVFSFLGFDAISTLSEEAKEGAVAVGRATILSLIVAATLFVLQTWLASLFVLERTSFPAGEATNAAFYNLAAVLGGYWFKFVLTVPGVFLSALAGAVTAQAATARLIYAMARDGTLPAALARVEPRRKVPGRAVGLVATMTLLLSLLLADRLELLISMISFGALCAFILVHASVIAHFIVRKRSGRWLYHFVVPAVGLLIVSYVLWNAERPAKLVGATWLAIGMASLLGRNYRKRVGHE